jgi:hypothetical protein
VGLVNDCELALDPVAAVDKQVDGKPNIPAGATLVTTGQIFVQGAQTLCAAKRAF